MQKSQLPEGTAGEGASRREFHNLPRDARHRSRGDVLGRLTAMLEKNPVVQFYASNFAHHSDRLLKNLTLEATGPDRRARFNGRWVVNFGSDSFLGLDQDPRIQEAVRKGLERWGTHNGMSRAFSSVSSNVEAEQRLAQWLKVEATLIYPSTTLANHGALPALVTRHGALVVDQQTHHSVHEGKWLVQARGCKTATFAHNDLADLEATLRRLRPYRHAVVAVDGIFSMTGIVPPLAELRDVAERHDAILYVDDAHATGIMGKQGRGTVLDALGDYRNTMVVGSLSKAFSCAGAFVTCPERLKLALALRSGPIIFGGPVPPPYLDAICAVVAILESPEYDALQSRLQANMHQFLAGARQLGLTVFGGVAAIASILVGDEDATLTAGCELFERGYYVQSVVFPGVPRHRGILRVQINANHQPGAIAGLLSALADIQAAGRLPENPRVEEADCTETVVAPAAV
jgi:7-keto-8-aminopelargonate synthetase-like enzyme